MQTEQNESNLNAMQPCALLLLWLPHPTAVGVLPPVRDVPSYTKPGAITKTEPKEKAKPHLEEGAQEEPQHKQQHGKNAEAADSNKSKGGLRKASRRALHLVAW